MENLTIRGAGKVSIDVSHSDGQHVRKTNDFLSQLAKGCVKYSERFIEVANEAPAAYREKQSTGMIAYALSQFADTFQTETPVRRKTGKGEPETFGWADFWAHHRNTDFLLELKQSYFYLHSNVVTKELANDWKQVNDQVKSFQSKKIASYAVSDSVVSIPFLVVPLYLRLTSDMSLEEEIKKYSVEKAYQKIKGELKTPPSWGYVWKVKKELIERTCYQKESGSVLYLPGLVFLARILPTSV